jgi:hypothetical protein
MEQRQSRQQITSKRPQAKNKPGVPMRKTDRISKNNRLARECAKLDPREEKAFAEGELEY